jgi:folylpolyglutamate synthase/dihydropteroate synthase
LLIRRLWYKKERGRKKKREREERMMKQPDVTSANDEHNDVSSSSSSYSYSYSYESAVQALLSPGIHQSTTKEDIIKSALRRTKTVSDMRYYWNKILKHTNQNNNVNNNQNLQKKKKLLIHITGTKGKGSTACMCESILRENGYKTGLFTSPHLIDIRERIRYNGKPIHESIFSAVYWKIRNALESEYESECNDEEYEVNGDDKNGDDPPPKFPGYFRMLTLMGMYTFLYELSSNVDVIILEVGMGGRYDATNFLDTTTTTTTCTTNYNNYFQRVVHGVTLLDLDHTRILGNTLEQIAWEKGGIFAINKLNPYGISSKTLKSTTTTREKEKEEDGKPSLAPSSSLSSSLSKCYILDSNTPEVINMMKSCARVEGGGGNGNGNSDDGEEQLVLVDSSGTKLKDALLLKKSSSSSGLGLAGNHQYGNATLAMELCQAVTSSNTTRNDDDDDNDDGGGDSKRRRTTMRIGLDSSLTLNALSNATWPGRCQTLMWSSSSSSSSSDDGINNNNKNVRFYLDGAHTPQSLDATVEWFRSKSNSSNEDGGGDDDDDDEKPPSPLPILVFNCSHERNPVELLELLLKLQSGFSRIYFAQSDTSRPSPIAKASAESLLKERGITIQEELLMLPSNEENNDETEGTKTRTWQETLAIIWKHLLLTTPTDTKSTSSSSASASSKTDTDTYTDSSIIRCNMTANEIVQEISLLVQHQQKDRGDDDDDKTLPLQEVFVTGSLYLVGSFLTALGWNEESSPPSSSLSTMPS